MKFSKWNLLLPVIEFKVDDLFFSSPKSKLTGVTSCPAFSVENSKIPCPGILNFYSRKCLFLEIFTWFGFVTILRVLSSRHWITPTWHTIRVNPTEIPAFLCVAFRVVETSRDDPTLFFLNLFLQIFIQISKIYLRLLN